jgi:hypothetical protein
MNDRQQQIVAAAASGLVLVVVFLCPWRIESTGELKWSPIYQSPMSYVRSYDDAHGVKGSSRIESEEAHIAYGALALEVLALGAAGVMLFMLSAGYQEADEGEISER